MKILVTGGAGFIGSNLVRLLVHDKGAEVVNVDALTYAANLDSLADLKHDARHRFVRADIRDGEALGALLAEHRPDAVLHLAAESHVDRSIEGPAPFVETNVVGSFNVLEQARRYWSKLAPEAAAAFRLLAVSTDEVYGSLGPDDPPFTELTRYDPSSPYAATKAGADHLARAYHRTYGLPVILTNCSNNYGPYQFPEKLLPLMITRAVAGESLPIYGRGENVREWIYVDDHCEALWRVLEAGEPGRTYNIGGGEERRNIDLVETVCDLLEALRPAADNPQVSVSSYRELVTFVADRPGHDLRYAIDGRRISDELGWRPAETLTSGLQKTIRWYLDHPGWIERVTSGAYRDWIDTNYGHRV